MPPSKRIAELARPTTVLQPTTFTDILARAASSVATNSWGGAAGSGRANMIDTRDVGDAAYTVLRDGPNKHADQTYRLTGPEALTMHDVARRLSALLETEVSYQERTPKQQANRLAADGLPLLAVEILLGVDEAIREEWLADTTTVVSELTGVPPRPIDQWLGEHLADFRAR
jgi:NAD(P)H dehydrogenase (quinone)